MLYYFSSQDMMISHTLARHLFWKEHILFKEDVPLGIPLTVTLSGQDLIVPTKAVWDYLTDTPMRMGDDNERSKVDSEWEKGRLKLLWFGEFNHADLFNSKGARREMAKIIRRQCEKSTSAFQNGFVDAA